jgi:hypothetical protein
MVDHDDFSRSTSKRGKQPKITSGAATNRDEESAYYQACLYLYGSKGRNDWSAELSLIDFARWGAVAFRWLAA